MKHAAILLSFFLASGAALAQDATTAADLFYEAFWLDQSGEDAKQAEALYAKVLAKFPKSKEAPRALVGLVRLRVARQADASDLLDQFQRYPDAKREFDMARRLVARTHNDYSAAESEEDSTLVLSLKRVYRLLQLGDLTPAYEALIGDLGERAHPMLESLMRGLNPSAAYRAAQLALEQGTKPAYALLRRCVLDESVLFRTAILDAIAEYGETLPRELGSILEDLYAKGSVRVRKSIIGITVESLSGDHRDAGYRILKKALGSKEDALLYAVATASCDWHLAPVDVCEAFVAFLERNGPRGRIDSRTLPYFATHESLSARAEALLDRAAGTWVAAGNHPREGLEMIARVVMKRNARGVSTSHGIRALATSKAGQVAFVAAVLDAGTPQLVAQFEQAARSYRRRAGSMTIALPDDLRRRAIERVGSRNETTAKTAAAILRVVRLQTSDWPAVLAVTQKLGRLHSAFANYSLFYGVGGVEAAKLARLHSGSFSTLLGAGRQAFFLGAHEPLRKGGRAFFEVVIPRCGPGDAQHLAELAASELTADLVAKLLVDSKDVAWRWDANTTSRGAPGPWVLHKVTGSAAAKRHFLTATADARYRIASHALGLTHRDMSAAATKAVVAALQSPHDRIVQSAIRSLAERDSTAVQSVVPLLGTEKWGGDALKAIRKCGDPAFADAIAQQLPTVSDALAEATWSCLQSLDARRAGLLALKEVDDAKRSGAYRQAALETLTRTDDGRRIEVFRRVLQRRVVPPIPDAEEIVLEAVGEQYLHELGPELLRYLRHPNSDVRLYAQAAIKQIQFYMDAKKTLEAAAPDKK